MNVKYATAEDIAALAAVEAECFPPAEAATEKEFIERVQYYGNHFWLMYEEEKLIAFVDGFVTDEPDLTDEMYEKAFPYARTLSSWNCGIGFSRSSRSSSFRRKQDIRSILLYHENGACQGEEKT